MRSRVRRATREDMPVVRALRHRWAEEQAGEELDEPDFAAVFEAWFEREHDQRATWLAYDDRDPVGMLNLLVFTRMPKPDDHRTGRPHQWGYVANAYVDSRLRGRGIGARLLEACTAHAQEQGYARLVLSPSERSVPFYARAAFEPATRLMVRHLR